MVSIIILKKYIYLHHVQMINKTIVALNGWIECFDGVELKGTLLATSVSGPNTLAEEFKNKAYSLGEGI